MISFASRGGKERRILFGLYTVRKEDRDSQVNGIPRMLKDGIPHANKLCDNTQDIQMGSIRK